MYRYFSFDISTGGVSPETPPHVPTIEPGFTPTSDPIAIDDDPMVDLQVSACRDCDGTVAMKTRSSKVVDILRTRMRGEITLAKLDGRTRSDWVLFTLFALSTGLFSAWMSP